jgi:SAM-dependent methyltransferase
MDEGLWDAYDRMGLSFQEHAADSAYNAHYDRPAVLAALGPVTGLRVLDAACGPGLYLRELLERGAKVSGFDASPVMVALARQLTANQVRIEQAVLGEPLPYPDCAFDLIVCALAIHYASDLAARNHEGRSRRPVMPRRGRRYSAGGIAGQKRGSMLAGMPWGLRGRDKGIGAPGGPARTVSRSAAEDSASR